MTDNKLNFNLDFLDNKKASDKSIEKNQTQDVNKIKLHKSDQVKKGHLALKFIWIAYVIMFFISYLSVATSTPDKCKSLISSVDGSNSYSTCISDERGSAYWNIIIVYGILFVAIFYFGKKGKTEK